MWRSLAAGLLLLCRRFAAALAGDRARLEVDVDRLLLHRIGLAPTTHCRSPGALRNILYFIALLLLSNFRVVLII